MPSKDAILSKDTRWTYKSSNSALTSAAHAILVAAFLGWIMALPLFPSQDGPVHLFYTDVLRALLFSPGTHFAQFFVVKHLLPPYSLYYYLLMGLESLVPFATADKLVVCLYVVSFAFGFRYMARAMGPSGNAVSLLALPLLFNWALFTGLTSFLLSTTLVFWTAGLWARNAAEPSSLKRIAFLGLVFLTMLSHPVPLALLGVWCGLELTVRLAGSGERRHTVLRDLYTFLAGFTLALLYVLWFGEHSTAGASVDKAPGLVRHFVESLRFELELASILPFRGSSAFPLRLLWLATLAGVLLLLAVRLRSIRRGQGESTSGAIAWAGVFLFSLLALPLIPDDVGGGHNFAYRMMIYLWLSAFAAASMWDSQHRRFDRAAVAIAALITVLTLVTAQRLVRPVAQEIADAAPLPESLHAQAGVQLVVPHYREAKVPLRLKLSFDPFQWAAARLFRRADAVLLNSPWLEEAVLPLGATSQLPAAHIPAGDIEDDRRLRQFLMEDAQARNALLGSARFVVLVNGLDALPGSPDPLLTGWNCVPKTWYSMCMQDGPLEKRFSDAARTPR